MSRTEESGSPGWFPSYFTQKTEDGASTAATSVRSPRPSVVYSSKEDSSGGQLNKLQRHVSKVLRGFSHPPKAKSWNYNPEILTTLKRQWTHFQLQSLDHKSFKEPLKLFESMVVVGLHPNYDSQALQRQFLAKRPESSGKIRVARSSLQQSRVGPNLEPQVLFVYPPEKQLPLKYKDLLSFCFPGGLEVRAVDRTPSMSEINEILLSQEHLKQSDLSFVFRLQVADNSTLYGCCVLVQELVQKPSGLISMISDKKLFLSSSRHVLTTRRCYCILSRLPFFELHFGVLNSILTEERLEQLTTGINDLDLESQNGIHEEEHLEDEFDHFSLTQSVSERDTDSLNERADDNAVIPSDPESDMLTPKSEYVVAMQLSERNNVYLDYIQTNRQTAEGQLPHAVSPLHFLPSESSDSSSSFLSSPSEDRYFRGDIDETGTDETSFSGQDYSTDHNDVLEWAKANNYGSLQIICEYYRLHCPSKGSTLTFNPLEHLHPLEFHRPTETVLHIGGSTIDLKSCSSGLQLSEAHSALLTEEEAAALSAWTIACECGTLRLENVLMMFAGALLEKQVVVVCSNLGTLSALVLSVIPLLRPYQWQCLLMPILPDDMLDFLDAPIPYVVGVKNKTTEVQSKMSNVILVDANKNQVKAPTLPQLPQHKELFSSLSPYHAKLVGESYLAKKRPVYECTDIQIEAAKGFLSVVRSYLDSLCSNLRSHTITNVQSNNDKVSLLLKESFIESFPSRDRPFMKLFVETQLFSVHTDLVLSSFQKE